MLNGVKIQRDIQDHPDTEEDQDHFQVSAIIVVIMAIMPETVQNKEEAEVTVGEVEEEALNIPGEEGEEAEVDQEIPIPVQVPLIQETKEEDTEEVQGMIEDIAGEVKAETEEEAEVKVEATVERIQWTAEKILWTAERKRIQLK